MARRANDVDDNDEPTVREPGKDGTQVARAGWLHTESLKSIIGA